MACKNVCRICDHLAISEAVAFTDGNLVITLPENSYRNGEKVCIVVAQTIPEETTITAPVVIADNEVLRSGNGLRDPDADEIRHPGGDKRGGSGFPDARKPGMPAELQPGIDQRNRTGGSDRGRKLTEGRKTRWRTSWTASTK